jgi:hypothetical protein
MGRAIDSWKEESTDRLECPANNFAAPSVNSSLGARFANPAFEVPLDTTK